MIPDSPKSGFVLIWRVTNICLLAYAAQTRPNDHMPLAITSAAALDATCDSEHHMPLRNRPKFLSHVLGERRKV